MGFVVSVGLGARRCQHEEANIQMKVGGLAGSGRNLVDVQIDGRVDDAEAGDAGFLARFGQCDRSQIGTSVGVTAGLEPPVELDVVEDQSGRPARIDHRRRRGQVPGAAGSVERIGVGLAELEDLGAEPFLFLTDEVGGADLLDGGSQIGGHGGTVARVARLPDVDEGLGGETGLVEGSLGHHGGGE